MGRQVCAYIQKGSQQNIRYRNTMRNISRTLINTTDILNYFNPPHRADEQVKYRI